MTKRNRPKTNKTRQQDTIPETKKTRQQYTRHKTTRHNKQEADANNEKLRA